MTSAEQFEAGRRALARQQGRTAAVQRTSGADETKLPEQDSRGPTSSEGVAETMVPKVQSSNIETQTVSVTEPGTAADVSNRSAGIATNVATPAHDKDMANRFLAALDPNASRFTFQFFSDHGDHHAEILNSTLDEMWPKVQALNTPSSGVGIFVTINETNLKGRNSKNILCGRASLLMQIARNRGSVVSGHFPPALQHQAWL